MPELQPCPACGNIPSMGYLTPYYHLVGDCSFCNDIRLKSIDEKTLIKQWNRREKDGNN